MSKKERKTNAMRILEIGMRLCLKPDDLKRISGAEYGEISFHT